MSMIKQFAILTFSAPLLFGCAPTSEQSGSLQQNIVGGWSSTNSAQAFGGVYAGEQIRGVFHSLTPPEGVVPSLSGWWLRSQNADYFAPIDSITYNDAAVTDLSTTQGWLQVAGTQREQIVQGIFDLQLHIGGQTPGTLRMRSTVDAHSYGMYVADWKTSDKDGWQPYCPHPYVDTDGQLINLDEHMIPVGGARWLINGSRVDDAQAIQLSCTHDSIGGCVTWGYAPWDSQGGVSLKNTHQACTRMKRADFCGTGDPATTINQSGYLHTQIQLWDSLGIHTMAPQTTSTMEAYWNPNGATCFNQLEYRSDIPNYVDHMHALLTTCPKPACGKGSSGLVGSARPCLAIDPSTGNCVQN